MCREGTGRCPTGYGSHLKPLRAALIGCRGREIESRRVFDGQDAARLIDISYQGVQRMDRHLLINIASVADRQGRALRWQILLPTSRWIPRESR